jgi:adenine-specific DNA-methyltransferase
MQSEPSPKNREPAPATARDVAGFGLFWPGKAAAFAEAALPPRSTLVARTPNAAAAHSVIAGDNLEALRLLRPQLAKAVRLVYVDPPYNAGAEYLYADTFHTATGDGRRHSRWLDLMAPRLVLTRELLRSDGVLFVSIGDHELAHLRLLCDEVFGEENFVACVPRIAKRTSNKGTHFAPSKDYLLAYARDLRQLPPFHDVIDRDYEKRFRGKDERGRFATVGLYQNALDPRPNQRYWIACPDGSLAIPPGETFPDALEDGAFVTPRSQKDRVWRWSHQSYRERRELLVWKKSKRSPLLAPGGGASPWNVYTKYYLEDRLRTGLRPRDFLDGLTNDQGTAELKALGLDDCFPFAKPVGLVQRLLQWIAAKDAVVLDYFAGSGTTAHAVLAENAADGGTRRFVLVQDGAPTGRTDFATIADLTIERIARAKARLDAERAPRPGEPREFAVFDVRPD